ncbi:MAG: glycosyltransferase family 4 protein, partial [Parcubacteria group bacterium]|nr:glycosyltransferase family 4 protein [Parcubacteria group bacterium]
MSRLMVVTQKVDQDDQLLGFFVAWLAGLAQKFEQINVICLEKKDFILPSNVKVWSLSKNLGKTKINQLLRFYRLIYKLRDDYDSVFVHMNPIWVVVGGWLWRLLGKKIVFWYTSKGVTLKLRLAEKIADLILTASKESFRIPSAKLVITGHGIDVDLFKPNSSKRTENFSILSIGRIAPVKNYETLIEAARILFERNFDFSITMIGEPALAEDFGYQRRIKEKIKNLNLDKYFAFLGKVKNRELPSYYQSHHLLVHLSKTGSLDKVVLEAMAAGLTVLSSNDSS